MVRPRNLDAVRRCQTRVLLLTLLAFGVSVPLSAATDPASEIAALEKKLAAARDELAAAKTALAISKSETAAAETRLRTLNRPDSEVEALRGQVRVLERDLQSATTGLKRIAADKSAIEGALFTANQQLVASGKAAVPPRGPVAESRPNTASPTDAKAAELATELTETRNRLTTAGKTIEALEAEVSKLRAAQSDTEKRAADSQAQARAGREFEARVKSLESENAARAKRLNDAEGRLAALNEAMAALTKERDELRTRVVRTTELESRLRQLETERTSTPAESPGSGVSKDEFAKVATAKADAEGKLATVLRSYTLLTKERDELRLRVAELSRQAGESEKR